MQNDANCRFAVRMNRAPSVWEGMNAEIVARASQGRGRGTRSPALRRESPMRGPAGPLEIAQPRGRVGQRQLARRPLLRQHRFAVVEVPDLDADAAVADVRVDRRVILPDSPQAFGES